MHKIVLASSSPYRRELMARLRLPFEVEVPNIDESLMTKESVQDGVLRLALAKAKIISAQHPEALVIGSDQLAECEGIAIGKSGNHERAVEQLSFLSGKTVVFQTAVALVQDEKTWQRVVPTKVTFRILNTAEIDSYLRLEQPYSCAGSAKNEALGISLMDAIETTDPTALTGLPLITLCHFLREAGVIFYH